MLVFLLLVLLASSSLAVAEQTNAYGINLDQGFGLRILEGQTGFGRVGDTSQCPHLPWTAAQTAARVKNVDVKFSKAFTQPPSILLSLTGLDMSKDHNARYNIEALKITTTGFTLQFRVWCETYVYSAIVQWKAIGMVYPVAEIDRSTSAR